MHGSVPATSELRLEYVGKEVLTQDLLGTECRFVPHLDTRVDVIACVESYVLGRLLLAKLHTHIVISIPILKR